MTAAPFDIVESPVLEYFRRMPGSIQSIERAAAILRLLERGSGRLALGEIAAALGLAKGTVHGILRTLQDVGFVEQDQAGGRYQLPAGGPHARASRMDPNLLRARAMNWSDSLAARSGEAVRIGVPSEGMVLVVHHVFRPDDTAQTSDFGATLPLHATAWGKVLLAWDNDLSTAALSGILPALTSRTVVKPAALTRMLADVRAQGWAIDVGEFMPGEASVAAPLRLPGGSVVGAIGVSGPADRLCANTIRPRQDLLVSVVEASRSVSRDLAVDR